MRSKRQIGEQSQRERGAALVTVLIFGIGAMGLVLTLITLARRGVEDEAARHRMQAAQMVLKSGVAISLLEVNKHRKSYEPLGQTWDPAGDGVGALIGPASGGLLPTRLGVPIKDSSGREIGRFRTTYEETAGGKILMTVIAATPSFEPSRFRHVASAQVEVDKILPPWLADRQALSIVGDAGGDGSVTPTIDIGNSSHLNISDPNADVPAINVSDGEYYTKFLEGMTTNSGDLYNSTNLYGANPVNGTATSGTSTIDQTEAGKISDTTAQEIAAGVNNLVATTLSNSSNYTDLVSALKAKGAWDDEDDDDDDDSRTLADNITLDHGTYVMESGDLDVESVVSGSGTLIIQGDLSLTKGSASLDWDGTVIVVGTDGEVATLNVDKGSLTVSETLAIQGLEDANGDGVQDSNGAQYSAGNGTTIRVGSPTQAGTMLLLSDTTTKQFTDSGSDTIVYGLMIMMGDNLDFETSHGGGNAGNMQVTGSMIMAVPEGSTGGLTNFKIASGGGLSATFNNSLFEGGLTVLSAFVENIGGSTQIFPVGPRSYVEGVGLGLLTAQDAKIALWEPLEPSDPTSSLYLGYPE